MGKYIASVSLTVWKNKKKDILFLEEHFEADYRCEDELEGMM